MSTTMDERRKAAELALAKLAEVSAAKAEAEEIAMLELELKCTTEIGARGAHFEIVDLRALDAGMVVVKRGDSVVFKRFSNSKKDEADAEAFVIPCLVHPSADEFRVICNALPNVLGRVALAVDRLYGARSREDAGKF